MVVVVVVVVGCCWLLLVVVVVGVVVVVDCYMCDGQNMECFPKKGNGHPVIDTDLYTHCSHPTCYTCLLRRGLVLQTFFHIVPLVDSGPSDFLA